MYTRMDFSSIALIIKENTGVERLSNPNLFRTLFDYAFNQGKYKIPAMDESTMSRCVTGERGITRDMVNVYKENENITYLKQDVEKVLTYVNDSEALIAQLVELLHNDVSISEKIKAELLCTQNEREQFIANCLLFGMSRKPLKRGKGGYKKETIPVLDYLLGCSVPRAGKVFVGRERELDELHQHLTGEVCLFLEGIGGIGKSELVKQYAKHHKKDYENIIYLRYTGNLQKTIAELNFIDDLPKQSQEERFQKNYQFFQRLQQDTLVILDNFDTTADKDDLFYDFLSLSTTLLVTTRCHLEDVPVYQIREIASLESLLELFYAYAPSAKTKESVVIEIIEEVHRHTLTVEMAAKTIRACAMPPEDLLFALREDGIQRFNQNKIGITKDLQRKNVSMYRHLETLFRLQELSKEKLDTLRYLSLVKDSGIDKGIFCKWLQLPDFNQINELIEAGWVKQEEETEIIFYHPFIHEMILTFEKPTFQNCEPFFQGMIKDFSLDNIAQMPVREMIQTQENSFRRIEPKNPNAYTDLLSMVYKGILEYLEPTLSRDDLPPQDLEYGHLLRGIVALLNDKDTPTAKQEFEQGISVAASMSKRNLELEANLYFYLWQCNLQQYLQTVKDGQADEALFQESKKNIDYALKIKKAAEGQNTQNAIIISTEASPFSDNAFKSKEVLGKFMDECRDLPDSDALLKELGSIAEELEVCTASYAMDNDVVLRLKTYYQTFYSMQESHTSEADSISEDA